MGQRRLPSVGRPPCDTPNRERPSCSVKRDSTKRGWPSLRNLRFCAFVIFFNPVDVATFSALRAQRTQAACSRRTASSCFAVGIAVRNSFAAAPRVWRTWGSVLGVPLAGFDIFVAVRGASLIPTSAFGTATAPALDERAGDISNRQMAADTFFGCFSGQMFISAKERLSLKRFSLADRLLFAIVLFTRNGVPRCLGQTSRCNRGAHRHGLSIPLACTSVKGKMLSIAIHPLQSSAAGRTLAAW